MSNMIGMDVADVRALSRRLDTKGERFAAIATEVGSALRRTTWKGNDAQAFTEAWAKHERRLIEIGKLLKQLAAQLNSEADQQEGASNGGGSIGGSGRIGSPPTGTHSGRGSGSGDFYDPDLRGGTIDDNDPFDDAGVDGDRKIPDLDGGGIGRGGELPGPFDRGLDPEGPFGDRGVGGTDSGDLIEESGIGSGIDGGLGTAGRLGEIFQEGGLEDVFEESGIGQPIQSPIGDFDLGERIGEFIEGQGGLTDIFEESGIGQPIQNPIGDFDLGERVSDMVEGLERVVEEGGMGPMMNPLDNLDRGNSES